MRILPVILACLLALAGSGPCLAQPGAKWQPVDGDGDLRAESILRTRLQSQYSNTWNVGSAKKLEGKVYLLEVWLTPAGTKWDYGEMCAMQQKINDAAAWLENLARSYGKHLEFSMGSFYGQGQDGIMMQNLPSSYAEASKCGDLLLNSLKAIGYTDVMQCYQSLSGICGCSNVAVLLLINQEGWSCTYNFSMGHVINGFESSFLENALIFRTLTGYPTGSQVIAHELMHIFGAWDMYGGQVSQNAALWVQSQYPTEIMLQISSPLSNLQISPLSAWLTGLSSEYQDWFLNFQRLGGGVSNQ